MIKMLKTIFVLGIVAPLVLQGCAAVYRPVHPEMLSMDDDRWTGPDDCVEIQLMDHVLDGAPAKRYAKMEKRNEVNLIALKVRNEGSADLHLPDDLNLFAMNGDTISFLAVEEALTALVDVLDFDHSNSVVEVETEPGWILNSWIVTNDVRKLQSHIRFVKNISDEYLKECVVHPGQEVIGFVVLPIGKGTPFQFSIR